MLAPNSSKYFLDSQKHKFNAYNSDPNFQFYQFDIIQ